jgi:hypothetical protein
MATIQPAGEKVRQALKWISDERLRDEHKGIPGLIIDASRRFNLSPIEEDFLNNFYMTKKTGGATNEK